MTDYETKDSGRRIEYSSGMRRDLDEGKPNFALISPLAVAYEDQVLTRWARLMTRGSEKYGKRNWEKARTWIEYTRFKSSAMRHFMQWFFDETDEDHMAATLFNISAAEFVKWKINHASNRQRNT